MPTKIKNSKNKTKIGTILDKEILLKVKERSLKEGRTISDIIHDALLQYNENDVIKTELREEAVIRFCSKPFHIKVNEINKLLSEDYFNQ